MSSNSELNEHAERLDLIRKYQLLYGCFNDLAEAFHAVSILISDEHTTKSFKTCTNNTCKKCVEVQEASYI